MKKTDKILPKYSDFVFTSFEDAKKARNLLMECLKNAKLIAPKLKHFISIADMYGNLYGNDISYRTIKESSKTIENEPDNSRYGWFKKPGIYEFKNGCPEEGYIFEDPELI